MATTRPTVEPSAFRRFVLSHQGDPRKGEELFRGRGTSSCASCHEVGSKGPDLAKFTRTSSRTRLIDALLSPRPPVAQAHGRKAGMESVFSTLDFTDLISYLHELGRQTPPADGAR